VFVCICSIRKIGTLLNVSLDTANIRVAVWFGWWCELGFFSSKNGRVDLRNTFVPDLSPHVNASASTSIQTVLSCESANVEIEPASIT